jgi:hypothetical protein
MSNEHFYTDFGQTVDKIISKYDQYIFIGDFNYDSSETFLADHNLVEPQ